MMTQKCHKTYGGWVYWYLLSLNFWCSDLYGTAKVNPWNFQNRKNEEFWKPETKRKEKFVPMI